MRFVSATKRLIGAVVLLSALGWAGRAHAQVPAGTWVRTDERGKGLSMTVEPCCKGGLRLTYSVTLPGQPPLVLTVDSPMDGTEVPALVAGLPSGQTMAIKRVDDRHYNGVVKMGGKPYATSTATVSADGKTLTVETVTESAEGKPEKITETWVRK